MSYSIHRQPKYLITASRESGRATCMGCFMEEYPSDFETYALEDLEQVIETVATLQAAPRERQEPEWEIQIFSDQTLSDSDFDDDPTLSDDFDRRVEEATRRKTAEHEKASREAEKKERAEAAERRRQRDMKELQRLRAKYEAA